MNRKWAKCPEHQDLATALLPDFLALSSTLLLLLDPKFSLAGKDLIHCQMVSNKFSLLPIWVWPYRPNLKNCSWEWDCNKRLSLVSCAKVPLYIADFRISLVPQPEPCFSLLSILIFPPSRDDNWHLIVCHCTTSCKLYFSLSI